VHDCINVEHVYSGDWRLPVLRMATQRLLRNAARVVAISNATKSAILKNYDVDPAQIIVIPSACRLPTFERVATDLSAEKVVRQNFILMVTNALPHKNASFAMKALASSTQMRKELTELKIVGQLAQGELESYQATGLPVTVQTRVSDDKLRDYYRSARFLLSPSLAEGHNLPIAEAICSGGNVVCSDIDVHREFYSGCAIFFDPHRVDSAVAAIDDALSRTTSWSSAGALPVRYFKEMASEYCDVFQSVH
jgi:glycosyltransferase involved in cell wall biosynthesis